MDQKLTRVYNDLGQEAQFQESSSNSYLFDLLTLLQEAAELLRKSWSFICETCPRGHAEPLAFCGNTHKCLDKVLWVATTLSHDIIHVPQFCIFGCHPNLVRVRVKSLDS